jgi:putative transposase
VIVDQYRIERPKDISKACRLLKLSRSSLHCQSIKNDGYMMQQLEGLAQQNPVEGFWKCYHRIRSKGEVINHKKLHRIYNQMGLPMRRKIKKRLPARV